MSRKGLFLTFLKGDGFTLLEVVIAVAILALALVTLIQTQNGNIRLVSESARITTATLLAQRYMTELTMNDLPALGETSGSFADEQDVNEPSSYLWFSRVTDAEQERLRRIELTVSWPPHTPGHSVTLVTLLTEHGAREEEETSGAEPLYPSRGRE